MILESSIKTKEIELTGVFLLARGITIDSCGDPVQRLVQYRCRWLNELQKWEVLPISA